MGTRLGVSPTDARPECYMGLARIFHIRSGRKPSRFSKLQGADVKCDFREPKVIRVVPTPLHNTFQEVWRFAMPSLDDGVISKG